MERNYTFFNFRFYLTIFDEYDYLLHLPEERKRISALFLSIGKFELTLGLVISFMSR